MKLFNILREINSRSHFLWEVQTNGKSFTVLCESTFVWNDEDEEMSNLSYDEAVSFLEWVLKHDALGLPMTEI